MDFYDLKKRFELIHGGKATMFDLREFGKAAREYLAVNPNDNQVIFMFQQVAGARCLKVLETGCERRINGEHALSDEIAGVYDDFSLEDLRSQRDDMITKQITHSIGFRLLDNYLKYTTRVK